MSLTHGWTRRGNGEMVRPPPPQRKNILGPRLIEIISDYLQTEKHILVSDNCCLEA